MLRPITLAFIAATFFVGIYIIWRGGGVQTEYVERIVERPIVEKVVETVEVEKIIYRDKPVDDRVNMELEAKLLELNATIKKLREVCYN